VTFVIWSSNQQEDMVGFADYEWVRRTKILAITVRESSMTSRAGNWMIAAGTLAVFCGICILPAALGEHRDAALLGLGACLLSLGAFLAASGIYWKARALQSKVAAGTTDGESKPSSRRVRGGCELCASETPAIYCRVHRLQLCPTCLAGHYDSRSCVYVPTSRKAANKSGKSMAAKRGA
jgi:hypothetical protein